MTKLPLDIAEQIKFIEQAISLTKQIRYARGAWHMDFTDDPTLNNCLHAISNLQDLLDDLLEEQKKGGRN